ncbi:transglutaminase domain-containing protein [Porphyromonas sp.]|uniref:transglutaminase domain-containing protein n=1 Tax=Porphyromonas sp. TaxID=1924944 RepID=UPI0026DC4CD4|nr:transglutaminase domain-containing protein [Porphyromonas sp.]MDO4771172.1 transglutaminase domain-containing protein [Porphyromonas sp.]
MKHRHLLLTLLAMMVVSFMTSCRQSEKEEALFPADIMKESRADLEKKITDLGIPNPLEALSVMEVSQEERDAMEFLYAYMVTPDILDFSIDFHLKNVRQSLKAREEMPWGKSVPTLLFRHFVLPVRANNEAIDESRIVLYDELKEVVAGKDMYEAVLALNHWCHRHVTYAPSDGRTSSPLATMRNALGRCGEESTFTVAILRTMGIPARQVYTPRWAHTDDNHAWVEAWVDGKWHYLGACEPAPKLGMAWFDAPVLRAMLLHTKAFGKYKGAEEALSEHPTYTEINVTSNYVPTAHAKVRVVDADGTPVEGVPVTFRLYNYAELYPLVTRTSDSNGMASTELGLGDIVVVAGDSPDRMGILHYTVTEGEEVKDIVLKPYSEWDESVHFKLVPPAEKKPTAFSDSLAINACNIQMGHNDSIRHAYTSTFPSLAQADELAKALNIRTKEGLDLLRTVYIESRGNQEVIRTFLSETPAEKRLHALFLLRSLSDKDLHDVTLPVLREAINETYTDTELRDPNLISLRVWRETLYPVIAPLKNALSEIISGNGGDEAWTSMSRADKVRAIVNQVERFRLDEQYNPIRQPLSPETAWRLRMGDRTTLTVLLVRLLRTARIPAMWAPAPNKPVYMDEKGKKVIISFLEGGQNDKPMSANCILNMSYEQSGYLKHPKYETNFTIGFIDQQGRMGTYGFDYAALYQTLNGEELIHAHNFISSGTRLADGAVLYNISKVRCGEVTPLVFDRDTTQVSVIGGMDPEKKYFDLKAGDEKTILSTTGRGYFVLIVGQAHHEPTDHVLRDMQVLFNGETPKIPLIALTRKGSKPSETMQALLPQATWGEDTQDIINMLRTGCQIDENISLPVVAICDTFGRIVHINQGYTIGIGIRVSNIISSIKE